VAIVLKVGPAATTLRSRLDVTRSLTLLRVFLVASAAILLLAAAVLGSVLSATIKHQAIDFRRDELLRYVDAVLGAELVRGDNIAIGPKQASLLDREVRRQHDLLSVKVWRADGKRRPMRSGARFVQTSVPSGRHTFTETRSGWRRSWAFNCDGR